MAEVCTVAVAQKGLQGCTWELYVPVTVAVPLWLRKKRREVAELVFEGMSTSLLV